MESDSAGLDAVKITREKLRKDDIHIILRTWQPGRIVELDTVAKYDINDYKTKRELTKTKLATAIIVFLRVRQQIKRISNSREELEKTIVLVINLLLSKVFRKLPKE